MSECHLITDRMPGVAHGRASWRPAEAAHLASCPECAREWELVRAAMASGSRLTAGLDTRRIAEAVRRRLTAEPRVARRPVGRGWWLAGLAAAAALVLMVTRSTGGGRPTAPPPRETTMSVLHELDDLTASELEAVLETIPEASAGDSHVDQGSLNDLDARDLERVLRSLEG